MTNNERTVIIRGYWAQPTNEGIKLSTRAIFACWGAYELAKSDPEVKLLLVTGKIFGDRYPSISSLFQDELVRLGINSNRLKIFEEPIDSYTETKAAGANNWADVGFAAHMGTIVKFVYPALKIKPPKILTLEEIYKKSKHIPPSIVDLLWKFKSSLLEKNFWIWENIIKTAAYILIGPERYSKKNSVSRQGLKPNFWLPIDSY